MRLKRYLAGRSARPSVSTIQDSVVNPAAATVRKRTANQRLSTTIATKKRMAAVRRWVNREIDWPRRARSRTPGPTELRAPQRHQSVTE